MLIQKINRIALKLRNLKGELTKKISNCKEVDRASSAVELGVNTAVAARPPT
jgi:hypothetical protein